MIAKSDLVILAISGALLATGIYRWQSNLRPENRNVTAVVAPARNLSSSNTAGAVTAVNARTTSHENTDLQRSNTLNAAPDDNFGGSADGTVNGNESSIATRSVELAPPQLESDADTSDAGSADTTSFSGSNTSPLYGTYRVKPGDSLSLIADTHGTSVDTLRTINSITGSLILVDQEILYPLPAN